MPGFFEQQHTAEERSKLDEPIAIRGNGSSMWGESGGEYHVDDYAIDEKFGHLTLYGPDLVWQHYTDELIEQNVAAAFLAIIERDTGRKVSGICWSEQGMQPEFGWDFDVSFEDDDG